MYEGVYVTIGNPAFCLFLYIFKLGFTPCKGEQTVKGMELQETEAQKD